MFETARAVARFLDERIGWNRIGFLVSASIIAVAAVVLFRILRGIDVQEVVRAFTATPPRRVALAAMFVAAGYFTLTFYDLFALRSIGKTKVPYRAAALAGFTSYSVGHNVGASVFTGGAVRYHIYSRWSLSAVDVAKVCFVAGLTFWLGNITVLGLGVAIEPEAAGAITQFPAGLNRAFALVALTGLLGYVGWVWVTPREVGRRNWSVKLPGGPLTLLQIAIGIVDLSCCSLAMYMLMPAQPPIDVIAVAVVFVTATLLGFASHSPGGLGVFDAAMLLALPQFAREDLLASLLLFRLLYYITPFLISLMVLGAREIWLAVTRQEPKREAGLREDLSAGLEAHSAFEPKKKPQNRSKAG